MIKVTILVLALATLAAIGRTQTLDSSTILKQRNLKVQADLDQLEKNGSRSLSISSVDGSMRISLSHQTFVTKQSEAQMQAHLASISTFTNLRAGSPSGGNLGGRSVWYVTKDRLSIRAATPYGLTVLTARYTSEGPYDLSQESSAGLYCESLARAFLNESLLKIATSKRRDKSSGSGLSEYILLPAEYKVRVSAVGEITVSSPNGKFIAFAGSNVIKTKDRTLFTEAPLLMRGQKLLIPKAALSKIEALLKKL